MLRGNHPARVDDKGRLKIPNGFRTLIESQYGPELFVTSVTGEFVRLYPMAVWLEIERKLAAVPSTNPSKLRFLDRVNFFGQVVSLDRQGRVVLPQMLRETAAMAGDVSVLGLQNQLAVWNLKRLQERFKKEPFTEEDGRALSELGI
jgi:MraZ protein